MAHGRNKYQARINRARARDVLMREWDPIGVSGIPEAADEYDSDLGTIYLMLLDARKPQKNCRPFARHSHQFYGHF
jgi:hypothetical protein